jgi:hypothetical protein
VFALLVLPFAGWVSYHLRGGADRPEAVQQRLLIRTIPSKAFSGSIVLHQALGEGQHIHLDLGDYINQEYLKNWKVLSHTFFLNAMVERCSRSY